MLKADDDAPSGDFIAFLFAVQNPRRERLGASLNRQHLARTKCFDLNARTPKSGCRTRKNVYFGPLGAKLIAAADA